jgi:hypothetical protein
MCGGKGDFLKHKLVYLEVQMEIEKILVKNKKFNNPSKCGGL